MTYKEKLLDPRWQKKRLGVLERDGWECQSCGDTETTLHIHHKKYNGCDPWDIEDCYLTTLCKECHDSETNSIKRDSAILLDAIKKHFLSEHIITIAEGFHNMELVHSPEVQASAIGWFLSSNENINLVLEKYFNYLSSSRRAKLAEELRGSNG